MPDKFYTKSVPNAGNGLFAAQNIAAGEQLMRVTPPQAIAVLNTPRLQDTCTHCFLQQSDLPIKLRACTGCYVVKYCSKVRVQAVHLSIFEPDSIKRNARLGRGNNAISLSVKSTPLYIPTFSRTMLEPSCGLYSAARKERCQMKTGPASLS